jgi:hypothetical protein
MKQQFEATLTGSDTPIYGIATKTSFDGYDNAYEFKSIDNSLHLIIAKDDNDQWQRIAGTEPFLPVWINELVKQIV